MPKKSAKSLINLDLLRPQSEPQRLLVKAFRWILSAGRYLIIGVEVIVLGAFIFRFKLDADIAATKETIEEQVPFIESLKADEELIRTTQFQVATIKLIKETNPDYSLILQKIADQTPTGVTIVSLNLQKSLGKTEIKISGTASSQGELSSLMTGLKEDENFIDLNLVSVSLEQGVINFTLTAAAQQLTKNL